MDVGECVKVQQGEHVCSPLACLPALSSDVKWRHCTKYVVQPLCGSLLLVLLLVHHPGSEKSKVITSRELKWKLKCAFHAVFFFFFKFFFVPVSVNSAVAPFPILAHLLLFNHSAFSKHICHPLRAVWILEDCMGVRLQCLINELKKRI